jgi:diacylglycerol O-acyltransferase
MAARQRLGVQDALWLEMDRPGNLMVVDSLFWTAAPVDWDRYREVVRERLWDRYLVFRSVVVRGAEGGWYWEEQEGADLDARYEQVVLAEPGGDAELQELISTQRVVPLDRSEPLWRSVCVDNYRGGSAVLFRAHHAIADGIRMVQLALSTFDATADGAPVRVAAAVASRTGLPQTGPPHPEMLTPPATRVARVRTGVSAAAGASRQVARTVVTNPVGAAHTAGMLSRRLAGAAVGGARSAVGSATRGWPVISPLVAAVPGDLDTVRKLALGTRNDHAPWTGEVGERKAIAWSPPLDLQEVKAVARAHDATVNDVLVTCVAESLRVYLATHHGLCDSVTWDVPVNLKPFDPDLPVTLGNAFAIVQLELPTSIEDPLRTLAVVRRRMNRIKRGHEALVDFGVQAAISRMNKRMYRLAVDVIANRSIGVLTNVPGPQIPLYAAGQLVDGMLGWAPVTANQVMSFTIYSYAGRVFVGIAADAGQVPEHQQVVDGFGEAFGRLLRRSR